jgi:hypothetical protein
MFNLYLFVETVAILSIADWGKGAKVSESWILSQQNFKDCVFMHQI